MKIKETRERLKLSQAALGEHLGISGNTIARWERGDLKPTSTKLVELALFGLEIKMRDKEAIKKIRQMQAEAWEMLEQNRQILERMNA
ncbi:MAG TPA: helix-turn-helix transcriptional regulator [Pyrinomonadaceae bacterium]|nr:helix-turn-helix transcriptional regulator [Pyrinomonadaceae bacterium]